MDLGRSVYVFAKIALSEVAVFVNTSQKILVWLECTKDQLNGLHGGVVLKIIAAKGRQLTWFMSLDPPLQVGEGRCLWFLQEGSLSWTKKLAGATLMSLSSLEATLVTTLLTVTSMHSTKSTLSTKSTNSTKSRGCWSMVLSLVSRKVRLLVISHSPGFLELLLLLLPKLLVVMVHHAQGALGHHQALRLPRLPASWPSAFCRDPATGRVSRQIHNWE